MEEAIEQLVRSKEGVEEGIVKSSELLVHKEQELKELEQQVQTIQDDLDVALAERQRLVEEEEQRELEMKDRLDNLDVYDAEVDSEDIVPIFETHQDNQYESEEEQHEWERGEQPTDKLKRLVNEPYELEEDEEEIIIDDDSAFS